MNRYHRSQHRPRRLRISPTLRQAYAENQLTPKHLIQPLFIVEGSNQNQAIPSMPGIYRRSIDRCLGYIKGCMSVGVHSFALFPVIEKRLKSDSAEEAFNPSGLIQRAISEIKSACPQATLISDIALDPYTSHGHDGIINSEGYVLNDETIDLLVQQALSHVRCGVDIIAPSDMMDHRIGIIRSALDQENWTNTLILSYTAKYASYYYAPFRQALSGSETLKEIDKSQYQMSFTNSDEALNEAKNDIDEGADIIMVKPGLPYLDVIQRLSTAFKTPISAYHVSGEYSLLKTAIDNGLLPQQAVEETLVCFRRAGAKTILTYFAEEYAQSLNA